MWRLRLDWIVGHFSRRPVDELDARVLNILRMGILQISVLDRVPERAQALAHGRAHRRAARAPAGLQRERPWSVEVTAPERCWRRGEASSIFLATEVVAGAASSLPSLDASAMTMPTRSCCAGKFTVPVVGVGTWQFGSAEGEYWGERDQEQSNAIAAKAIEKGAAFFDCAEAYQSGRAESALAVALAVVAAADPGLRALPIASAAEPTYLDGAWTASSGGWA